jgi:hypothetical protein
MEVILDEDTGRVYIKRKPTPPGVEPQQTTQFEKFGIKMVWDGTGDLLGVEFSSDPPEVATVRTVSSEEMLQRQGVVANA